MVTAAMKLRLLLGFPWWFGGKKSACQCKTHRSLVQEDPTCCWATKTYAPQVLSLCPRAQELHQEKQPQWEAPTPQLEKSLWSNKDPAQLKINKQKKMLDKKSYDKPRQHIKKQRHHFVYKGPYSQSYGFSSSHVQMWELYHKEG